jgi:hypothetical protein
MEGGSDVVQGDEESVVVLYDKDSGELAFIHHETTSHGGRHPDQKELERKVVELASRLGRHDTTKLALLHVDPQQIKPDARYKVDVGRQQLVEVPETQ